ncbi:MAG: hypothetical protein KGJ49_01480 [Alphaproteobacteria bacterium]|nr:hypothetical protein [Alphaproteobacteria bacterium]
MKTGDPALESRLTSTQIGAIGEAVIAAGLMLASDGRLAPFKPFADDDGIDLLLFDKVTKQAVPLQVKCRTKVDDDSAETVQFDVRRGKCPPGGFVLTALLDGASVRTVWLVPVQEFKTRAQQKAEKFVMVASAKPTANDQYRVFRHDGLATAARAILAQLSSAP